MRTANLVGRVATKELEERTTSNGNRYLPFRLAVKQGKNETMFMSIMVYNEALLNVIKQYGFCNTGNLLAITGDISTYKKDEQDIYQIVVRSLEVLQSKKQDGEEVETKPKPKLVTSDSNEAMFDDLGF